MQEIWESGNLDMENERYGERPTGKWAKQTIHVEADLSQNALIVRLCFRRNFLVAGRISPLTFQGNDKKEMKELLKNFFAEAHTGRI